MTVHTYHEVKSLQRKKTQAKGKVLIHNSIQNDFACTQCITFIFFSIFPDSIILLLFFLTTSKKLMRSIYKKLFLKCG